MTIKRHVLAVAMLALCIAGIYPIARSIAAPKDGGGGQKPAITFDDPAHATFFKYQAFLAKQGEEAETKESWKLLEGPERAQKVAEGEAFLKELLAKLMAKKELSPKELQLIEAVWGLPKAPDVAKHFSPKGREKEKARTTETVNGLSKDVGEIRTVGNWKLMFDGDDQVADGTISADGGAMGHAETPVSVVEQKPEVAKTLDRIKVPLAVDGDSKGGEPRDYGRSLPIALGAFLLGCGYLGFRRFSKGASSSMREKPEIVPWGDDAGDVRLASICSPDRACSPCNPRCNPNCIPSCSPMDCKPDEIRDPPPEPDPGEIICVPVIERELPDDLEDHRK